jgi:hypothetical protein
MRLSSRPTRTQGRSPMITRSIPAAAPTPIQRLNLIKLVPPLVPQSSAAALSQAAKKGCSRVHSFTRTKRLTCSRQPFRRCRQSTGQSSTRVHLHGRLAAVTAGPHHPGRKRHGRDRLAGARPHIRAYLGVARPAGYRFARPYPGVTNLDGVRLLQDSRQKADMNTCRRKPHGR